MKGNILYNVSDPVNPQDVAMKEYADKVGDSPFFKENGNHQATHTINMAHNKLVNLCAPSEPFDAATKDYADYVKTKVEAATKEYVDRRPHIITVHANFHGPLIRGKYQFTF